MAIPASLIEMDLSYSRIYYTRQLLTRKAFDICAIQVSIIISYGATKERWADDGINEQKVDNEGIKIQSDTV